MNDSKIELIVALATIAIVIGFIWHSMQKEDCRERVVAECREQGTAQTDCLAQVCLECRLDCPGETTVIYND